MIHHLKLYETPLGLAILLNIPTDPFGILGSFNPAISKCYVQFRNAVRETDFAALKLLIHVRPCYTARENVWQSLGETKKIIFKTGIVGHDPRSAR